MSIEAAIYSIAADDGGIAALVGTGIWPVFVPQGESFPAVTYQQISGVREHACDGPLGLCAARFQLNCWAEGATAYTDARALADACRAVFDGYEGTVESTVIQLIRVQNEMDVPGLDPEVEQRDRHGRLLELSVTYED